MVMKRFLSVGCIAAMLCVLLSGCWLWMDGHYEFVTPHQDQSMQTEKTVVNVASVSRLTDTLVQMVEDGTTKGVISLANSSSATISIYMESAIRHIKTRTAIGAYTVNEIAYEIGENGELSTIAVTIDYRHNRSEILKMAHVTRMGEATDLVYDALESCQSSIAFRVDEYEETDFSQLVSNYALDNPDLIMECPQIKTSIYPQEGKERIVELIFTYQTSLETLKFMQEKVAAIFTSAELYVPQDAQVRAQYAQIYSFLMERFDYSISSTTTPAYSLLYEGVGDSHAFATVYATMCRKAGLECWVVTGTRNEVPWTWNLVYFRGGYYHLDLLYSYEVGGFTAMSASVMENYTWDYSAYPG